jgi:predicted phosphodiesterase
MRVLVLSDIHANLAALEAVLDDAQQYEYRAIWCLGDIVGYGPEPNECITRIRLLEALCVAGNHDWAVLGRMDVADFNPEARRAVEWTQSRISPENLAWLGENASEPVTRGDMTITHGSPRDPIWEYILYPATAQANFDYFSTPYCLVGHTHVPALYLSQPGQSSVRAISPVAGQPVLLKSKNPGAGQLRIILNPGSVGQPRDNDPRASYALLDTSELVWQVRRVTYPIEITQARMRAAELPERLINRLSFGW